MSPRLLALVPALMIALSTASAGAERRPPLPLSQLVKRIPDVVTWDGGIGEAEEALAKELRRHGPAAVPIMLGLLEDDDPGVRRFAGYVVRDLEGLNESHLDALIAARRRGNGWLPVAIGRIGTERAVRALVEDLRIRPDRDQTRFALERVGERAARAVAEAFAGDGESDESFTRQSCKLFRGLGARAHPALEPLRAAALRTELPIEKRVFAVAALRCLQSPRPALPSLIRELQGLVVADRANFRQAVEDTIIALGAPESVPILVRRLPILREYSMQKLIELGTVARAAGPAVMELFELDDWDLHVEAIRTLGVIGYGDATEFLVGRLRNEQDWRQAYFAAESLGRLGARSALPSLENVARAHWYPPVRAAAAKAIRVLRGSDRYGPSVSLFKIKLTTHPPRGPAQIVVHSKGELSAAELSAHPYEVEETLWRGGTRRFVRTAMRGLRVDGTLILGSDHGEFMGELVVVEPGERPRVLLRENVHGLHATASGIVVVTGLAHMATDEGALFLVNRTASGELVAIRWRTLPGAPTSSRLLPDGRLLVTGEYTPDVIVSPTGEFSISANR